MSVGLTIDGVRRTVENIARSTRFARDELARVVLPRSMNAAQDDLVAALLHLRKAAEALERAAVIVNREQR